MSQTIRKIKLESPVQAIDEVISGDARALSANLQMLREKLFPPEAKKQLRKFSSGEAAKLIGVTDSYLRLLSTTGEGPCWEPSWLENIELRAKKAMKRENIDQEYSHV
jgi:chromosome partitioning protein